MNLRKKIGGLLVAMVAVVSAPVYAALPAEAAQAFTDISTAVTDVLAAVWPIAAAVMAGFITLKLVKKGAGKAT